MGNIRFNMAALMVAVLWLHFVVSFSTTTKTTTSSISPDQSALLQLKAHVIDDPHNFLATNWSTATSVCNWIGVSCGSRHQRVTALNLSNMSLSGTLPPQIGNLSFLSWLDLSNNSFHGSLPVQLANLHRLKYIRLSKNSFYGEISSWFAYFSKLEFLSLSYNNFTGHIPSDICDRLPILKFLLLGKNEFSGKIPMGLFKCKELQNILLDNNRLEGILPKEIGNLTMLKVLFLNDNMIKGRIPRKIGNLINLEVLDISNNELDGYTTGNKLEGCIPYELSHLKRLIILDLNGNKLGGAIPAFLGHLVSLRELRLDSNKFSDSMPLSLINCSGLVILNVAHNNISHTFPHWLGMLPNLRVLILKSNRFHGPIKDYRTTSSFSKLQMIDLSYNHFSGILPTNFFQNLKAAKQVAEYYYGIDDDFKYIVNVTMKGCEREFRITVRIPIFTCIDLSMNGFRGEIPEAIGELRELLALNLSHNSLTGPIPTSIGNLSALESLDLSFNKLSGEIPLQMTDLTFLAMLRLCNNNLVGPIPRGKQFETFDNNSYSGNLGLCGFPLSRECNDEERPELVQDKEGNGIAFIWKVVMMGYGCGVVLGLSTGYIVFTTGRPWWLVRMVERDFPYKFSSWVWKNRVKKRN